MNTDFFWTVLFGAFVVESLVNIVNSVKVTRSPTDKSAAWQYWVALFVGLGAGVVVGINYDIDVFRLVGIEGKVPLVGAVLTGLIMSRGANVVSDVMGRLNAYKK